MLGLPFIRTNAQQTGDQFPTIEPGKPLEREIAGGELHTYKLKLAAGQFMHLVVEQKGIDVAVALITPDGKQLVEAHEVVSLPSASVLAIQRTELAGRELAPKTLAVIADPRSNGSLHITGPRLPCKASGDKGC